MVGGHPINRLSELLPSNWHASSKSDPPASIRSHERRLTARSAAADNRLAVEAQIERGPAADHRRLARRPVLNDPIQLIGPASLVGNSRETFHKSGTDGSNP